MDDDSLFCWEHLSTVLQHLVFSQFLGVPVTDLSVGEPPAAEAPYCVFRFSERQSVAWTWSAHGVKAGEERSWRGIVLALSQPAGSKGIWDAIENGPFIPMFEKEGSVIKKPWSQWTDAESKKVKFDCIAKNIITYALNSDEFFKVSQCKSSKEMWDTLEVVRIYGLKREGGWIV